MICLSLGKNNSRINYKENHDILKAQFWSHDNTDKEHTSFIQNCFYIRVAAGLPKHNKKRWGVDNIPSLSPLLEGIQSGKIWKKENRHSFLKRYTNLKPWK